MQTVQKPVQSDKGETLQMSQGCVSRQQKVRYFRQYVRELIRMKQILYLSKAAAIAHILMTEKKRLAVVSPHLSPRLFASTADSEI